MSPEVLEQACKIAHESYEQAAATFGWETQERSRVPWADVPEANKQAMRVALTDVLLSFAASLTSTAEKMRTVVSDEFGAGIAVAAQALLLEKAGEPDEGMVGA